MDIWKIIVSLSIVIGFFLFSTALHEIAHIVMCKILNCKIIGFKILFIKYDGKTVRFTLRGKNHCAFVTGQKKKMRLIVLAGPIIELLIFGITLIIASYEDVSWIRAGMYLSSILIGLSVIYNLLPASNGDGKILFGKEGM